MSGAAATRGSILAHRMLAGKIPKVTHEKNKYFVISNLGAAVIVFLTISSPPFKALLRAPGCSLKDAAPRQANVQDRGFFFFVFVFLISHFICCLRI